MPSISVTVSPGRTCTGLTGVVCAALALVVCATPASATVWGQNGKIAFYRAAGPGGTGSADVFTINPDGSGVAQLTTNPEHDGHPAWSPDGSKLAFDSRPSATAPVTIWTMNADGTGKAQVTTGEPGFDDLYPAWSPDGTKIVFVRQAGDFSSCSRLYTVASDGTGETPLAPGPECSIEGPDWSPDGTKLAYYGFDESIPSHGLYVANADNTAAVKIRTDGRAPSWSPGGIWLAYSWVDVALLTPDGQTGTTLALHATDPDWSPNGARFAFMQSGVIYTMSGAGSDKRVVTTGLGPAWQPIQPPNAIAGYPRPKGATPMTVSLVPAFESCTSANSTHGAPLAFGSCEPPAQSSSYLTVGTPDANGALASSIGRARVEVRPGDPGTAADEADVAFTTSISDVRCRAGGIVGCDGTLADYTGTLRENFSLQATDEFNGGTGKEAATLQGFESFQLPFVIALPCAATAGDAGSTCSVNTTVDALAPELATEGKRTTWQLGRIELWDAGEDGNPSSDDNTLFAVQGVFVP